jgi:hypothetical protein
MFEKGYQLRRHIGIQLPECTPWRLKHLRRILRHHYIPTPLERFYLRRRATGISESTYIDEEKHRQLRYSYRSVGTVNTFVISPPSSSQ